MHRRIHIAFTASIALLASSAAAASAAPTVSVDDPVSPSRAIFSDASGTAVTDDLTVTIQKGATTTTYLFAEAAAPVSVAPVATAHCQNVTPTSVRCDLPTARATGVDVDLAQGAVATDGQTLQFIGDWVEQTTTGRASGAGADSFTGAGAADRFEPGAGADRVVGGAGRDTVGYAHATAPVRAWLDGTPSGVGCPSSCEGDTFDATIENLTGGPADDVLTGNGGVNELRGAAGADELRGVGGDDRLFGEGGDDVLGGGLGSDALDGGAGSDTASYAGDGRASGVVVTLRAADGSAQSRDATAPESDTLANLENATGSEHGDILRGGSGASVLRGGAGDDTLYGDFDSAGLPGADVAFGDDGSDTFRYDDGRHDSGVTASIDGQPNDGLADTDTGASGAQAEGDNIHDTVENLVGGPGDDTFAGSSAANVLDGNGGTDTVSYASRPDAIIASLRTNRAAPEADALAGIENLVGGAAGDILVGDNSNNRLEGRGGDDLLLGGFGADLLDGGAGTNTADYSQDGRGASLSTAGVDVDLATGRQSVAKGGPPEDTLVLGSVQNVIGTQDDDVLSGDAARNVMTGGDGADSLKLVDATADEASCGGGTDVVEADHADVVGSDCENVTRKSPDDGGDGGGDPPAPPCSDPATCGALVAGVFEAVFGCSSVETCQDKFPGGGEPPAAPCADPASCEAYFTGIFESVFGCSSPETCQDKFPGGGGGGGGPAPPCADPASCGTYFAGIFDQVFGCSSAETCQQKFPDGGSAPAPPCADPASCGTYFAGIFDEVFGCSSVETCQQKFPGGGGSDGSGEAPAESQPPDSQPARTAAAKTSTGAAVKTRKRPRLTLRTRVRRDRRAPYRFVVVGKLKRPQGVGRKAGCDGKVRVFVKRGKKTLRKRTGFVDDRCRYRIQVVLRSRRGVPKSGRLQVVARFLGNDELQPRRSRKRPIRAG